MELSDAIVEINAMFEARVAEQRILAQRISSTTQELKKKKASVRSLKDETQRLSYLCDEKKTLVDDMTTIVQRMEATQKRAHALNERTQAAIDDVARNKRALYRDFTTRSVQFHNAMTLNYEKKRDELHAELSDARACVAQWRRALADATRRVQQAQHARIAVDGVVHENQCLRERITLIQSNIEALQYQIAALQQQQQYQYHH